MKRLAVLVLLYTILLGGQPCAVRADALPPDGLAGNLPPLSRFIDKRESPAEKSTNFLAICSRPTPTFLVPGHAFFILGKLPPSGAGEPTFEEAAGFNPTEETWKTYATLPVPGKIQKEMLSETLPASSCRLVVRISDKQKKEVQQIIKDWNHSTYQLINHDCVTLIQKLAATVGLKLPPRSGLLDVWPRAYVRKLTELNGEPLPEPGLIRLP